MEEQNVIERPLMGEEEFKDYIKKNKVDIVGDFYNKNILNLRNYNAVSKFKSIRRAIKRGKMSIDGYIFPNRPFNNKANTCIRKGHNSRTINERKKVIYGQLKYKQSV